LVLNIVFWITLTYSVGKIIADTRRKYAEDPDLYGLAQLEIVEEYILGRWQWHRFIGMAVIVLVGDLICFSGNIRQSISVALQPISYGMTPSEISALLPQFGFLAFIAFAEGWIWYKRAVTRAAMFALNRLALKYRLEPR
jgi:hypothetical protein